MPPGSTNVETLDIVQYKTFQYVCNYTFFVVRLLRIYNFQSDAIDNRIFIVIAFSQR